MKSQEFYTATDLIELFFEFIEQNPNHRGFTIAQFKNDPPAYYRIQQLEALCRAFDIENVDSIVHGHFVNPERGDWEVYMSNLRFLRDLRGFSNKLEKHRIIPDSISNRVRNSLLNSTNWARNESIDTLSQIISPNGLKFSHKTMVDLYRFPDVDLAKIDLEHALF